MESRFSRVRTPPFGKVWASDVLLLKEVSGPIRALAEVMRVESFGPLPPGDAGKILEAHREALALEPAFLTRKRDHPFGTLLYLGRVISTPPLVVAKTDRRPWVVLEDHQAALFACDP